MQTSTPTRSGSPFRRFFPKRKSLAGRFAEFSPVPNVEDGEAEVIIQRDKIDSLANMSNAAGNPLEGKEVACNFFLFLIVCPLFPYVNCSALKLA